jgi:hypothetical protein
MCPRGTGMTVRDREVRTTPAINGAFDAGDDGDKGHFRHAEASRQVEGRRAASNVESRGRLREGRRREIGALAVERGRQLRRPLIYDGWLASARHFASRHYRSPAGPLPLIKKIFWTTAILRGSRGGRYGSFLFVSLGR